MRRHGRRLAVAGGTLLFLFVTLVHNPFAPSAPDLAELAPSGADFVVHARDARAWLDGEAGLDRLFEHPAWKPLWTSVTGTGPDQATALGTILAGGSGEGAWVRRLAGELLVAGALAPGATTREEPASLFGAPDTRPPFPLSWAVVIIRPHDWRPGALARWGLRRRLFDRFLRDRVPAELGVHVHDGVLHVAAPGQGLAEAAFREVRPPSQLAVAVVRDVIVAGTRLDLVQDIVRRAGDDDAAAPPETGGPTVSATLTPAARRRAWDFLPALWRRELASGLPHLLDPEDGAPSDLELTLDGRRLELVQRRRPAAPGAAGPRVETTGAALAARLESMRSRVRDAAARRSGDEQRAFEEHLRDDLALAAASETLAPDADTLARAFDERLESWLAERRLGLERTLADRLEAAAAICRDLAGEIVVEGEAGAVTLTVTLSE